MEEILSLMCSNCNATLSIKRVQNIETRNIVCPTCGKSAKFTDYKVGRAAKPVDKGVTVIASLTDYNKNKRKSIGQLLHVASGALYQLEKGINTIGRKTNSSASSIQIDTDDRTMSRKHAIIEVVQLPSGNYKHFFSNADNKNATMINDHKVENNDKLVLNGDEQIKMANVEMKFVVTPQEGSDCQKEDNDTPQN